MAISNRVGPPVTGDDFYGRVKELSQAHDYLRTNHSLVLSAPRRIGKSSFAKRLIEDQKALGWSCVYIDLEGVRTQEDFLKILINEFDKSGIWSEAATKVGGMANRLIEAIKGIGPVKFDFTHRESSENLYTSLFEVIDHSKDTLIVIDELTLFLNILDREEGRRESEFFLNWFRSLRQVTNSKIRWIFCGSVGLHNFTRSRSLSMTINDMVSFDFDALSNAEANGLVEALSEGEKIPIDQEIRNFILNKIEWYVPYFIQLLFTNIKDYPNSRKGITKEIVDDAYERLVRSDDLGTWGERLTEYNGQEPGAKIILKELSKSAEGLSRDQLFAIFSLNTGLSSYDADNQLSLILNMLEHDGYIMRAKGGIRCFRSSLLKQWWYYKFVE